MNCQESSSKITVNHIISFFTLSLLLYCIILAVGPFFNQSWTTSTPPVLLKTLLLFIGTLLSLNAIVFGYRKMALVFSLGTLSLVLLLLLEYFLGAESKLAEVTALISFGFLAISSFGLSQKAVAPYNLVVSGVLCTIACGMNIAALYGFLLEITGSTMLFKYSIPLILALSFIALGLVLLYLIYSTFQKLHPTEFILWAPTLVSTSSACVVFIMLISFLTQDELSVQKILIERETYLTELMRLTIPKEFGILRQYKAILQDRKAFNETTWDQFVHNIFEVSPALMELLVLDDKGKVLHQQKNPSYSTEVAFSNLIPSFSKKGKTEGMDLLATNPPYIVLWSFYPAEKDAEQYLVGVYHPTKLFIPDTLEEWMANADINIYYNNISVVAQNPLAQNIYKTSYETSLELFSAPLTIRMAVNPRSIMGYNKHIVSLITAMAILSFFVVGILFFFYKMKTLNIDMAKALKVKTLFLTSISHEMRTPLHGVRGAADLLSQTELSEKQKRYLGIIYFSSARLLHLTDNILAIIEIESGHAYIHRAPCNIRKICDQQLEMLNALTYGKEIKIITNYPKEEFAKILLPISAYELVLNNLMSNAIYFTNKGTVTLTIDIVSKDLKNGILTTTITDTGIGIPEEKLPEIFNKFRPTYIETAKKTTQGLGLGLFLIKLLVDAMEGTIHVASKQGIGSIFTVSLPIAFPDDK